MAIARSPMRFSVKNSVLQLQLQTDAAGEAGGSIRTLHVDLSDGSVRVISADVLPAESPVVLGVMGLLRLHGGSVIALVTKAKQVCSQPYPIFKVTATQLVTHEKVKTSFRDLRLAALLQDALDVRTYGQHMYFSYRVDLTRSMQTALSAKKDQEHAALSARQGPGRRAGPRQGGGQGARGRPSKAEEEGCGWQQVDQRFVFNRGLLQPLVDSGAEMFAQPIVVGYFGQVLHAVFHLDGRPCGPTSEPEPAGSCSHRHPSPDAPAGSQGRATSPDACCSGQSKGEANGREGERLGGGRQSAEILNHTEGGRVQEDRSCVQDGRGGGGQPSGDAGGPEDDVASPKPLRAGEAGGYVTLMARMFVSRCGTLLWRKGLDMQGNNAHTFEVEQALAVQLPVGGWRHFSHVQGGSYCSLRSQPPLAAVPAQVRGSVPLLWSQPPEAWPWPPAARVVQDRAMQAEAFGKFISALLSGHPAATLLYIPGCHPKDALIKLLLRSLVDERAHGNQVAPPAEALGSGAGKKVHNGAPTMGGGPEHNGSKNATGGEERGAAAAALPPSSRSKEAARGDERSAAAAGAAADALPSTFPSKAARAGPMVLHPEASTSTSRAACQDSQHLGLVVAGEGTGGTRRSLRGLPLVSTAARLDLICRQVGADVRRFGYCSATAPDAAAATASASAEAGQLGGGGGSGSQLRLERLQSGVLHCSCWDGVDESLPVQHAIGLRVLEEQLVEAGLMLEGQTLAQAYPQVQAAVNTLWNHLGNICADQVSGLGSLAGPAVKAGGDLPWWAWLANWYFAVERWFHRSFLDARKQDAMDLVTGAYQFSLDGPALKGHKHNYGALEMGVLLTCWGLLQACCSLLYGWTDTTYLLSGLLLPLAAGSALLGYVWRAGTHFMEQPQLCQHLLAPGSPPSGT